MAKARRKKKRDPKHDKMVLLGVIAVSAIVIIAAIVAGLCLLWRGVTDMEAFRVRPGNIALESRWIMPEAALRDFKRTDAMGILSGESSIFTPKLAQHVNAAYKLSPWVRRVLSVRKVFPNTLDVRLELREPFAAVSFREKWYCVDRDGVVLSGLIYELTSERLYELKPFVVLAQASIPPNAGEIWDDISVQAGLNMVDLCRTNLAEQVMIESVHIKAQRNARDMSGVMADIKLLAGPVVQWGRVPCEETSPAEVSTETKISSLLNVVKTEGINLNRLALINVRYNPPLCSE